MVVKGLGNEQERADAGAGSTGCGDYSSRRAGRSTEPSPWPAHPAVEIVGPDVFAATPLVRHVAQIELPSTKAATTR